MHLFQWIPFYRAKRKNERYMKLPVAVAEEGVVKYEALVNENADLKRQLTVSDVGALKAENERLKKTVSELKARVGDLEMSLQEASTQIDALEASAVDGSEVVEDTAPEVQS